LHPLTVEVEEIAQPVFNRPAPDHTITKAISAARPAIFNPFSAYEKGERLLRQELSAISAWHLVNIVVAYDLTDESEATLQQLSAPELVELIVNAVRHQSSSR
jgi:hypothetical protein